MVVSVVRVSLPRSAIVFLLIMLLSGALPVPSSGTEAQEVARWVVGMERLPEGIEEGQEWNGGTVLMVNPVLSFLVVLADHAFPERTSSRDDVRYVERDLEVETTHTPNDPRWSNQYGPQRVRADDAWDITKGTNNKVLCIIDTGLRYTHEDIYGSRWLGGRDVADGDNNVWDPQGHGTHVTGIAVATMDNGKGTAGIAQVPFKFVKVMESTTGRMYQSYLATGLQWCADNGAHLVSMSLGSTGGSSTLANGVNYAYNKGLLLFAASGNDGCSNCVLYPAKYSQVIAVGCTDSSNNRCSFSSGGPEVELTAPGYQIIAPCYGSNTEYCYKSGTSMSTPTASGVAALVWSYASHLSRDQMRNVLQDSAIDRGASGRDTVYGYGITDADAAIALAKPIDPVASFTATCSGATCAFDGSASYDPDGTVVHWSWNLGNGATWTGSNIQYEYTQSGTYTVTLTVTDNHGFTDQASRSVSVTVPPPVKSPPNFPPADPHVVDTQNDLIGDRVPQPFMDVESAWFDHDVARLYVGMKVTNMVNERANAFVAYRVYFTPTWALTDPTLGGKIPANEEVVRFEVRALYSPVGLPLYSTTHYELWAETVHETTYQHNMRHIADPAGRLNTGTDIIWWPLDRIAIGAPATATLTDPSAIAGPSMRGVQSTYGITADATGSGRDHTF